MTTRFDGVLRVEYGQFALTPGETLPIAEAGDAVSANVSVVGGASQLLVLTGCRIGPVRVVVRQLEREPGPTDLDEPDTGGPWGFREFVSMHVAKTVFLLSGGDGPEPTSPVLVTPSPGWFRVRIGGRGDRTKNFDGICEQATEEYLLEAWPDSSGRPASVVIDDGARTARAPHPSSLDRENGSHTRGEVHIAANLAEAVGVAGLSVLGFSDHDEAAWTDSDQDTQDVLTEVNTLATFVLGSDEGQRNLPGWSDTHMSVRTRTLHLWYADPAAVESYLDAARTKAEETGCTLLVHHAHQSADEAVRLAEECGFFGLADALEQIETSFIRRCDSRGFVATTAPGANLELVRLSISNLGLPVPVWVTDAEP